MEVKARKILSTVLGIGLILAVISLTLLWFPARPLTSPKLPMTSVLQLDGPGEHVTLEDIATLKKEIESLKNDRKKLEKRSDETDREIAQLRSQSWSLSQDQAATAPQLTPKQKLERAAAQIQAQVELVEGTLRTETVDPRWTDGAEATLRETFHKENMKGFQLWAVTCRTTLCRTELTLEGSSSPEESFKRLANSVPWQGQGFVRIDPGESAGIVLYLSREGYSLPRLPD
jgi:hypothetical protein